MSEPDRLQHSQVLDMAGYLRETIAEIDETIVELSSRRNSLAMRLAVIETSGNAAVLEAAEDYGRRVSTDTPYESAEPAEKVLGDAWKAFGPQPQ